VLGRGKSLAPSHGLPLPKTSILQRQACPLWLPSRDQAWAGIRLARTGWAPVTGDLGVTGTRRRRWRHDALARGTDVAHTLSCR
jgi:hypothetical protein